MSERGLRWVAAKAEKHAEAEPKTRIVDRGDWVALALIAGFGAYVRWRWTAGLPAILHPDSDSYFEIAQRLWKGQGFGDLSRRTPLHSLLLWATGKPSGSGFDLTLLVQHTFGVGTALLTYLTARSVMRYRLPSLLAGLAVGAAPVFILTEHSILSESLYTFLLVASGYFLLAFVRSVPRHDRERASASGGRIFGIVCGAFLGFACLTRPIAWIIFPLWLLLMLPLRGGRATGLLAMTAGVTWLMVLLPLLLRNERAVGSFSLTQSTGRNLISVTDLLVDYAAPQHRDVLSIYHRYLPNKRGPDAAIVYSAMPELRAATKLSDVQIDAALADAALKAILLHPWDYLRSRFERLPLLFDDPTKSQWYALHLETYVPLIEFTGKQNPEMTSRTIVNHPLKEIDFPRANGALTRWNFPFNSLWFLALMGLGAMAGVIAVLATERGRFASLRVTAHGGVLLIFAAVAASLGTAILMQPPNLRYRTPTLPWEILLAATGLALTADVAAWLTASAGKKIGREIPCWIPNVAVCMAAIGSFAAAQRAPRASAISVGNFVDSANQPAAGPAIIRQMPLAGKTVPMIYWRSDMPAPRNIRAEAPVDGEGKHHLQAAFSCGEAACANAQLKLIGFNALGTAMGTQEIPLARERTDNDWFWEQIDEHIKLPTGTTKVRFEISFEPGAGSLVIPFLSLTR
jgi:hypothetical protein